MQYFGFLSMSKPDNTFAGACKVSQLFAAWIPSYMLTCAAFGCLCALLHARFDLSFLVTFAQRKKHDSKLRSKWLIETSGTVHPPGLMILAWTCQRHLQKKSQSYSQIDTLCSMACSCSACICTKPQAAGWRRCVALMGKMADF